MWVLPKPNTATYFPGDIFHHAESTTRHFEGFRISVAWKLKANKRVLRPLFMLNNTFC
ncbi:MAG: hypothetical protein CM15mV4_2580 [Caudoviricetes sp.]|nr:MAG: hypothetical protein CM15mV4_2580 [Caudoviricetes sp.]